MRYGKLQRLVEMELELLAKNPDAKIVRVTASAAQAKKQLLGAALDLVTDRSIDSF